MVGSYSLTVSALASASQETFSFTSPASGDTLTIGGQTYTLSAKCHRPTIWRPRSTPIRKATVWATVTQESVNGGASHDGPVGPEHGHPRGQRSRAAPPARASLRWPTTYIAGTDAAYTINGGPTLYSSSNTLSGAFARRHRQTRHPARARRQTIPGVTLSLNGVTGSTPVTVTVGSPAPSTQNIQTAVQKFITDYNSAISQIQTQLTQTPAASDPTQGTLYGDSDLQQLLSSMRQMMASTIDGLPDKMNSMLDAGVSTGATTGTGAVSQSALAGDLTLATRALSTALTSNASGDQGDDAELVN